jgi:hypothetical protein
LVVNDGSLDILPDYYTLPDCCPLCYRPSNIQFADYLQFPDDPLNPEPTASSSVSNASCTPTQPELQFNDVPSLNDVFFGSELPHSIEQYDPNPLQPFDWNLFDVADGFLADCANGMSMNPAFEPFGMENPSLTDGNHFGEPSLGMGISETDLFSMNRHNDFAIVQNPTFTNASSLSGESGHLGDIQPSTRTASPEKQNSETFEIPDAGQVTRPPSPSGQFICGWSGCQTPFNRVAGLRLHVRSHTKGAQRCLWDGCGRSPEPFSTLNKHLDTHTKPHLCPEAGCGHRAAKPRDMGRHVLKHGIPNGAKVFYCPANDCQHNEGRTPFLRADNARRHIRQVHSGLKSDITIRNYNK